MKLSFVSGSVSNLACDLLVLGLAEGKPENNAVFKALDKTMRGALKRFATDEAFTGKRGQLLKIPSQGAVKASWVLLVGFGREKSTVRNMRLLGARASQGGGSRKAVGIVLEQQDGIREAAEGLVLGAYRCDKYRSADRKRKAQGFRSVSFHLSGKKSPSLKAEAEAGIKTAEAINLARDLVNAPPNELNPVTFADIIKEECSGAGIACKVLTKKQIEKEGMNLMLAVSRGSGVEPRFIHMKYTPTGNQKKKRVVFVGKGLTFDAGGLCLKPAKSMLDMKCDMAGAAVTVATVLAAAKLKLPVEVHGVIGSVENMTGQDAYRPSDIFTSLSGKTVEIINTDAEGRLVLADALTWSQKLNPDYLIDHATLTGACMVALGKTTAGLFSDDEALAKAYKEAAVEAGESVWELPLNKELRTELKSQLADLKHCGSPYGGSITAGLFLQEFVGKSRWLHMDIAGPSFADRPREEHPRGGTGFGVSTAIRFLENLS